MKEQENIELVESRPHREDKKKCVSASGTHFFGFKKSLPPKIFTSVNNRFMNSPYQTITYHRSML